jgi:hypothetical protein
MDKAAIDMNQHVQEVERKRAADRSEAVKRIAEEQR